MNKKIVLSALVLLVVCVILVFRVSPTPSLDPGYKHSTLTIAGKSFSALVSDTEALREQGLSGRDGLGEGQAMLFIFDKSDLLGFWMKDMRFSIDIMWLDADYRVVSFEKSATPESYPKIFFPSAPAKYVIELPAGTLSALGTKPGDNVAISGGK